MIAFVVYGVARPKGSMRAFQRPGMRTPIVTDGNRNVQAWQRLIAAAASAELNRLPADKRRLIGGGVRCHVAYFLPRPQRLNARKYADGVRVLHTTRPDIDKLTRAVLDALTGIAWTDDAQVVELIAVKQYTERDAPARVIVTVTPSWLDAAPLLEPGVPCLTT